MTSFKHIIQMKGLSLVELIIVILMTAIIMSVAIKGNQNFEIRGRWYRTLMVTIVPLKSAINQCLKDNEYNVAMCNDFSQTKLGRFIASAPATNGDFLTIELIKKNAAIKIIGKRCIVELTPNRNNDTVWAMTVSIPANSANTLDECQCFLKTKAVLDSYQFENPPESCSFLYR